MTEQHQLTEAEKTFLNRAAFHVANGLSPVAAMAAVIDDDNRIAATLQIYRPDSEKSTDAKQLRSEISASIYTAIRTQNHG